MFGLPYGLFGRFRFGRFLAIGICKLAKMTWFPYLETARLLVEGFGSYGWVTINTLAEMGASGFQVLLVKATGFKFGVVALLRQNAR